MNQLQIEIITFKQTGIGPFQSENHPVHYSGCEKQKNGMTLLPFSGRIQQDEGFFIGLLCILIYHAGPL